MTESIKDVKFQFEQLNSEIDKLHQKLDSRNETPKGNLYERLEACKKRYLEITSDLDEISNSEKEQAQFFIKSLKKIKDFQELKNKMSATGLVKAKVKPL